jgi:DNA topoisomerase VI subunit A
VLAIETQGMYERLVKHSYWKKANCILISLTGVPSIKPLKRQGCGISEKRFPYS